jgi:hypothetical protein
VASSEFDQAHCWFFVTMILASLNSSLIHPRPRTSRVRHGEEETSEELQTVAAEPMAADLESV